MLIERVGRAKLVVRKEVTDPSFGKDESWFFHRLKVRILATGRDCIKKKAAKDGNLVDENMYYIRERKGRWCIFDPHHAVRLVSSEFDDKGEVKLEIGGDAEVFGETAC